MKQLIPSLLFSLVFSCAISQNLLPNGGFELYRTIPVNLSNFYAESWYSIASNSTPDLFSKNAPERSPAHPWNEYVGVAPYEGLAFAGMILADKKSTYREYIGIRLPHPLQADTTYLFKIAVAIPGLSRYTTNTLDIIFSEISIFGEDGYTILEKEADISIDLDSLKTNGSWKRYTFEYTARGGESHVSIGNFKSKKQTTLKEITGRNKGIYEGDYNIAYVVIDDVQLVKQVPSEEADISLTEPEENEEEEEEPIINEVIVLKGIIFKTASARIENNQIPELEKIAEAMLGNEELLLEITGFTDNTGEEARNKRLSEERALSVKNYLVDLGIDPLRIETFGRGSESPVASNETEEGRSQNRRIEIRMK